MNYSEHEINNLKIIFSLISVLLMVPLVKNGGENYYRTLFIFLINRIIDMCFKKDDSAESFLIVWSFFNQWIGVIACAFSFCAMLPDFAKTFTGIAIPINITLLVVSLSCLFNEMVKLMLLSIREHLIEIKIKKEMRFKGGIS